MLLQITDGTVSVGGETVLLHVDFEIKGKEKIAIVGQNGVGKTTLLRLIMGELSLDRDDKRQGKGFFLSERVRVMMLRQEHFPDATKTVEEIIMENLTEAEAAYEYDRLFTGFGFSLQDKSRPISSFSGGEQTKIAMIRLLLKRPDILLLDEPTNHLDMKAVEWLEDYLREYPGAVVFVSHDRFFLDRVADVVCEVHRGKIDRYVGNYTSYKEQKRKNNAILLKKYESQQAEIKRLNTLIEQFKHKPKKAAFARSRRTILERMERVEKPDREDAHIFTGNIEPLHPGARWPVVIKDLKIGYDRELAELSLRVGRGRKIGIIGENGVGKSTFLKTLAGLVPPLAGRCMLGNNVLFGYFDQHTAAIRSEKTVMEHFRELFPALTEQEARSRLGEYLFSGKDAAKRVDALSGGEKSRLVLAEMLCARPNLLLLDEPTNHMDIPAKETLESAFSAYSGTIFVISHDRWFLEKVADSLLVFESGAVNYYPFGYVHYDKRRRENGREPAALMSTKEQAMIAGLKAVPKGSAPYGREPGTEEAYADWQLRLVREPLEEAEDGVRCCEERLEAALEEWRMALLSAAGESVDGKVAAVGEPAGIFVSESAAEAAQAVETRRKEREAAWEKWHESCLTWWETWEKLFS